MDACEPIRPSLYRIIDGDADPAEAMQVARHISGCTACRILLARKRRLAEMLENDLEDLSVGDEFVGAVMATLPEGPPPRPRRIRRGLKLACLAGLVGWVGHAAARGLQLGALETPSIALPQWDPGLAEGALRGFGVVIRLAMMAINALGGLAPVLAAARPGGAGLAALVLSGALLVAGGTTLFFLAAGTLARNHARSRSGDS